MTSILFFSCYRDLDENDYDSFHNNTAGGTVKDETER